MNDKKFEVLIASCKTPKITITPERVTIKHNGKKDYTKELALLQKIAEIHKDTTESLRGHFRSNGVIFLQNNSRKTVSSYHLNDEL